MKPTSSQYSEAFSQAFEKLNPAQRQAVEHIEGPVPVIASPGKIRIFAMIIISH